MAQRCIRCRTASSADASQSDLRLVCCRTLSISRRCGIPATAIRAIGPKSKPTRDQKPTLSDFASATVPQKKLQAAQEISAITQYSDASMTRVLSFGDKSVCKWVNGLGLMCQRCETATERPKYAATERSLIKAGFRLRILDRT